MRKPKKGKKTAAQKAQQTAAKRARQGKTRKRKQRPVERQKTGMERAFGARYDPDRDPRR